MESFGVIMHDIFASPGFWTAFMAMIGVLAGAFLTRLNSRDEINVKKIVAQNEDDRQDFEALHATVGILQSELSRIGNDVIELRKEVTELQLSKRRLSEKYSSAIAYINILVLRGKDLLGRLDQKNIPHGEIPSPPENLGEDLKS